MEICIMLWGLLIWLSCIWYMHIILSHWGRGTHICVGKITIIVSDNGLPPERRQAIICWNAGTLLIGPLGTNFSDILTGIQTFSFTKMHLKMSFAKWPPFCLGLNVFITDTNDIAPLGVLITLCVIGWNRIYKVFTSMQTHMIYFLWLKNIYRMLRFKTHLSSWQCSPEYVK